METVTKEFSTKDFTTMVVLKYFGHKFKRVTTEGVGFKTKRVWLDDTPEVHKLMLDYENNDLTVKAKDFMRTIEETKEFVHRSM